MQDVGEDEFFVHSIHSRFRFETKDCVVAYRADTENDEQTVSLWNEDGTICQTAFRVFLFSDDLMLHAETRAGIQDEQPPRARLQPAEVNKVCWPHTCRLGGVGFSCETIGHSITSGLLLF
jgi:hypothetical protein